MKYSKITIFRGDLAKYINSYEKSEISIYRESSSKYIDSDTHDILRDYNI